MWFRNLLFYRFRAGVRVSAAAFGDALGAGTITAPARFATESRGWVPPRDDDDESFLFASHRQWLFAFATEQKILPASVVREATRARAKSLARRQGHPVGRKQMRELREQALEELLPRALARRRTVRCWIDIEARLLVLDTANEKVADELVALLAKSVEGLPALARIDTARSPGGSMTQWLTSTEAPSGFSIDRDLELVSTTDAKSTVRYARHDLGGRDIREHVKGGKVATRLGLTWKDRVSFVLTDRFQLRRVGPVAIEAEVTAEAGDDAQERFESDFVLMTGELGALVTDLIDALGGEKPREG